MGTNWLGDSLGGAGIVSRRSVRIDCSHGRGSGSIHAENRAGRSVGCGRTERTVEERSNPLWALAFGRVQSDQGPNVYDRETPRSIRTTLGSWGTDLAQIFHPIFIMPDAIDRARLYFFWVNNFPDPHLETAPGSKTNLTDSFFGPTSSPTSRANASATRPPTFEHTLGVAHYFSDWLAFRPEVRLDYTLGAKAIDNGTKREIFTFSADLIIRFWRTHFSAVPPQLPVMAIVSVAPMLTMISVDFRSWDP